MSDNKFEKHKDHLNKTFLEDLALKVWSTKGARFKANKRLLVMADLSNKSMGFLSAYLIIFGLLSVYQGSSTGLIDTNLLAFGSTAISILLLAFSQMEAAQDYKVKAHFFHDCALALSPIHNEVRIFQTLQNSTHEEIISFCKKISTQYQNVLDQYPNHDDIDFKTFRLKHRKEYYTNINFKDVIITELQYYVRAKLAYHLLIAIPPIIIVVLAVK